MLVWSFRLDKDFSGQYEADSFRRHFWSIFFVGAYVCLAGCFGLAANLKSRADVRIGIVTFASGLALTIFLMPFVDFEGWTGASAYTLIGIVLAGAIVFLVSGGVRWLWQKFSTSSHINHS
jgi:hypothetical protein